MDPLEATDITAPGSRHNLHVTAESDLIDIGPWTQQQLYRAVERAESEDCVVVLDYGREQLYIVDRKKIAYIPPTALGLASEPGLRVTDPRTYDPDDDVIGRSRTDSLVVSPEFDILIPAFDWTEVDDAWEPPELDYREQPSGTTSGTVGG